MKTRTENVLVFLYALFCLCFLEKSFKRFFIFTNKIRARGCYPRHNLVGKKRALARGCGSNFDGPCLKISTPPPNPPLNPVFLAFATFRQIWKTTPGFKGGLGGRIYQPVCCCGLRGIFLRNFHERNTSRIVRQTMGLPQNFEARFFNFFHKHGRGKSVAN